MNTFTVFKTSRGLRWLAISSNNYEDRDREIVSKAALDADVARTAADGKYGPLRWWHIGEPDPLSDEPWGPGLDLGTCDFAAMDNRFLIESGTFKDHEIGEAIAAKAPQLALSIGFFHPRGEPDAEGVFHHIRRFERSLAPAGKVSNPLTAFYVPGATPMAMQDTQLKALADLLPGVPEEKIKALIESSTSQATKTAEAAGLRYKADDDTIARLEADIAALKAEMKAPEAAPPPAEEPAEEEEETEEAYAGDMTLDQFKALISEVVEKAVGAVGGELKAMNAKMNMAEKMGGMFDEMKAMFGGIQQKDAGKAERIERLETALKTLSLELAELRGDQPAAVVAASKSVRTALPESAATTDAFTVKTPDDKPAYAHPADAFGAWIESQTA